MGIYEDYINSDPLSMTGTAETTDTTDSSVSAALSELKASRLADRAQSKADRLQGVSYAPDQAATLQQGLSDVVDQQIYTETGPDGLPYKYQIDPSTGAKVPYSGETRNMYIAQGGDGSYKLGLARNDLTDRAKEKGMTPFSARYADKSGLFGMEYNSPYKGGGGAYDGTPGLDGVDPTKSPFLDVELPYDVATTYEQQVHMSSGQIKNRAMGQGPLTGDALVNYGSGKTEYSTKDAPLWNLGYIEDGKAIADGTPVGGAHEQLGNNQEEDTLEFVDAIQAGFVTLGGQVASAAGEGFNSLANNFRSIELASDNALETWGKSVQEDANKIAGYNPQDLEEGTQSIQEGFKNFTTGDYLNGVINIGKGMINAGPQVLGGSLPKIATIYGATVLAGPAGTYAAIGGTAAATANATLDEREKLNGGRKATASEMAGVMAAETLATALDYGVAKFIIGGKVLFQGDKVPRKLDDLLSEMGQTKNLVGTKTELVKALGRGLARSSASAGAEAMQEGTTEMIRTLAAELGTDKFANEDWVGVLDRNGVNILTSAALGAAGGVGFGVYSDTKETMSDIGAITKGLNDQAARQTAAAGLATREDAIDARTTRELEVGIEKDTLTKAYAAQSTINKANTPEELSTTIDILANIDAASANDPTTVKAYIQLKKALDSLGGIANPDLTAIKEALFEVSDLSLNNIVSKGKGFNKDIDALSATIDSNVLPNMPIAETAETTYQDDKGTQYKYTGDVLTAEITKVSKAAAKNKSIFGTLVDRHIAANPGTTEEEAIAYVQTNPDGASILATYEALSTKHQNLVKQAELEAQAADINSLEYSEDAPQAPEATPVITESTDESKAPEAPAEATTEEIQATYDAAILDVDAEITATHSRTSMGDGIKAQYLQELHDQRNTIIATYEEALKNSKPAEPVVEEVIPEPVVVKKKYSKKSTVKDLKEIATTTMADAMPYGVEFNFDMTLEELRDAVRTEGKRISEEFKELNIDLDEAPDAKTRRALADQIAELNNKRKELVVQFKGLPKAYKDAKTARAIARQMKQANVKTVGELEANVVKHLSQGLEEDPNVKRATDAEVKKTLASATRVAVKPTGLVKNFLRKMVKEEGTPSAAKSQFESRIAKLSSNAIEQLLDAANVASLEEAYKDAAGNISLTKAYFRSALEGRLKQRNTSKKYFDNKVVATSQSGDQGTEVAIAQSLINQSVDARDADAVISNINRLLDAVNGSSISVKKELLDSGNLDSLGTDTGIFKTHLAILTDGSGLKNKLLQDIELTKTLVKSSVADNKNIKKIVLRLAKSNTAALADIKFAQSALKDLVSSGDIDAKQEILLGKMLDKVLDRSTIRQRELEVQGKEEEAIITQERNAEIDANASLTPEQKSEYKAMPAAIYFQLFNKTSPYDVDMVKDIINEGLASNSLTAEELYVDDC